jgi:hypothetical protein
MQILCYPSHAAVLQPGALIVEDEEGALPEELAKARDLVLMLQHVNVQMGECTRDTMAAHEEGRGELPRGTCGSVETARGWRTGRWLA